MADAIANINKEGNNDKKYSLILGALVPLVNNIVSEEDGACSIEYLNEQPAIQQLIALIPEGFERKVKVILENYKDYFALLQGKYVVTYLGYSTGKVNDQNEVNEFYKRGVSKSDIKNDEMASAKAAKEEAKDDPRAGWSKEVRDLLTDEEHQEITLVEAADKLYQCVWLDEAEEFDLNLRRVQALREKMFGPSSVKAYHRTKDYTQKAFMLNNQERISGGPGYMPMKPGEYIGKNGRRKKIESLPPCGKPGEKEIRRRLLLREIIAILNKAPESQLNVSQITQQPKINMLKKYAIAKFSTFLDENTDKLCKKTNPHDPSLPAMVELLMTLPQVEEFMKETENEHMDYIAQYPQLEEASHAPIPPAGTVVGHKEERHKKRKQQQHRYTQYWQQNAQSWWSGN